MSAPKNPMDARIGALLGRLNSFARRQGPALRREAAEISAEFELVLRDIQAVQSSTALQQPAARKTPVKAEKAQTPVTAEIVDGRIVLIGPASLLPRTVPCPECLQRMNGDELVTFCDLTIKHAPGGCPKVQADQA